MKISKFIKKRCNCSQNYSGEYDSNYHFSFMLSDNIDFEVYGTKYTIDRINMFNELYDDESIIVFANENTEFKGITIPYKLLIMIYITLNREERKGSLKGYMFSDEIMDLLREM